MPSQSKEAVELYNLGLNLARQNRYEDAIAPLTEALKTDKNYNNAYNLLGKVYIHLGNVQQAQECWMEVLKRDAFNSTAMACLEASSPKRLVEHLRDMMPIIMVLVFVIGFAFVYLSIRKLDSRIKSVGTVGITSQSILNTEHSRDAKPGNGGPTALPPISNATFPTNGDSPTSNNLGISEARAELIDVEPDFGDTESQSTVETGTKSFPFPIQADLTQDTKPTQLPPSSSPPEPRVLVPTTIAELEARYSKATKLCLQGEKYTEALREFQALTQSNLSHRWVIGNAHYWAGICYLRLNQRKNARAEFQKVTKQNSYSYEKAARKILEIGAE
ncbi:tetratricopeptide repeat protein [Candidatus Poribacteria bacterium]|nr:tetratricopeptide repeat protein [Candidatus Poribacteria bacterium]